MYKITKRKHSVYIDGKFVMVPEQTHTFRSAAELLRHCLRQRVFAHRTGGRPYPTRFDGVHLGHRDHDRGYDYHLIDTFTDWQVTGDHLAAMRRAQTRYREIVHYWREVEPQWRPDTEHTGNPEGLIHFADNSVELHEISKDGRRRHRMTEAPSGDACF